MAQSLILIAPPPHTHTPSHCQRIRGARCPLSGGTAFMCRFLKSAHTTPKPWDLAVRRVRLCGLTNCLLNFYPPCSSGSTNESRTTVIRPAVYCQARSMSWLRFTQFHCCTRKKKKSIPLCDSLTLCLFWFGNYRSLSAIYHLSLFPLWSAVFYGNRPTIGFVFSLLASLPLGWHQVE